MGAYVAMTRVKKREHLLIYRPFDLKPFQQGDRLGPSLLLQHLRGVDIDWPSIEEKHMPSKKCSGCLSLIRKPDFLKSQWNRSDELSIYCKKCLDFNEKQGKPYDCVVCKMFKAKKEFSTEMLHFNAAHKRVCMGCEPKRKCKKMRNTQRRR